MPFACSAHHPLSFSLTHSAGNVEEIRAAIKAGAGVNTQQHDEALERSGLGSLDAGLMGPSALHLACMFGKTQSVEELLKVCIQIFFKRPIDVEFAAVQCADVNIAYNANQLKAATDVFTAEGNTPLHMAVISGRADVIELLIQAGADGDSMNAFGESPR